MIGHSESGKLTMPATLIIGLIAAIPIFFGIATAETVYHYSKMRSLGLPVLALELTAALVAIVAIPHLLSTLKSLPPKIILAVAALLLLSAFNALFVAGRIDTALDRLAANTVHVLAAIGLLHALRSHSRLSFYLLGAMAIGINIFEVFCYFYVLLQPDLAQFNLFKVGVGVSSLRQLANYGAIGTALALGLAIFAKDKRSYWLWLTSAMLSLAFILWSGSRGGLFGLGCMGLAAWKFLPSRAVFSKFFKAGSTILLPALALSMLWVPPEGGWGIWRLHESLSDERTDITSGRVELWRDAAVLIVQKPLTGYGEAQFKEIAPSAKHYLAHPHNFIFQFLVQWGFAGFGLAVMLIFFGCRSGWKACRNGDDSGTIAFMAVVTLLFYALVDGTFYHTYPLSSFILLLVVAAQRGIAIGAQASSSTSQ